MGYVAENSALKFEIMNLNKIIKDIEHRDVGLLEKIQRFAEENATLGKEAETRNNQYRSLQEHLIKISNVAVDQIPKNEETWKMIYTENASYVEIVSELRKDIKNLKANERKLLRLLKCLKSKGFPVDETYNELQKRKDKKKEYSIKLASEDEENINTVPAKIIKKPTIIPLLNFSSVACKNLSESDELSNSITTG